MVPASGGYTLEQGFELAECVAGGQRANQAEVAEHRAEVQEPDGSDVADASGENIITEFLSEQEPRA